MRREHKPRLRDLLGGRFGLLPIVWIGIGLSVFQQLVGINVIFYYSSIAVAVGRHRPVQLAADQPVHHRSSTSSAP